MSDSFICPECDERCDDGEWCVEMGYQVCPGCHKDCGCSEEPDGLDLMLERSMDAHDRRAGK